MTQTAYISVFDKNKKQVMGRLPIEMELAKDFHIVNAKKII